MTGFFFHFIYTVFEKYILKYNKTTSLLQQKSEWHSNKTGTDLWKRDR